MARAVLKPMDLAKRAAAGDAAATTQLLQQVAPSMMRVVRGVLGSRQASDAEDVLQQSLIAFIHALAAFRGECEPAGYACRIAVRTALATRKRSRIQEQRRDDSTDTEMMPAGNSPGEDAASKRRMELWRTLLEQIPEEQAEALTMRSVLGWSLEEIAAASGSPVNTIRSRLRLAKEALRKKIEADPALWDELEVGS